MWSPLNRIITLKSKIESISPNIHNNSAFNHIKHKHIIYKENDLLI